MFSAALEPGVDGLAPEREQRALDEANAAYHQAVDWALDLTEAEFDECDVRGVPGQLIRRDPLTQVLVRRESALTGEWRSLDLAGTYWPVALDMFLESGARDIVLVAPKRNRNFKRLADGLRRLRESGIAEPD